MPAEVIDLLSSPSLPSPPPRHRRNASDSPSPSRHAEPAVRNPAASDIAQITTLLDKPSQAPNAKSALSGPSATHGRRPDPAPIAPKRASTNLKARPDTDFLFLSDDFDTTGDLDPGPSKRPRLSPSPVRRRENGDSLRRTSSALTGPKPSEPSQPTGMKRWNSVADPIEYSSSPHMIAEFRAPAKRSDLDMSDHFASSPPPRERPSKPAKAPNEPRMTLSSDPFGSSIGRILEEAELPHGTASKSSGKGDADAGKASGSKPAARMVSEVIDLSSDFFADSPAEPSAKASKSRVDWDPISSSAPEARPPPRRLSSSPPAAAPKPKGNVIDLDILASSDTSDSDDMPELGDLDFAKLRAEHRSYSLSPRRKAKSASRTAARSKSGATSRSAAASKKTIAQREAEKAQKAGQKEAEKERKKAEREKAKEEKAIEKEKQKALAEVNRLRTDKKISTPEMIVDLPEALDATWRAQIEAVLSEENIHFETRPGGMDNVIRWRRKVQSKFNDYLGYWEPAPLQIHDEANAVAIMSAAGFVKLVLGSDDQSLDAHVLRMKSRHPGGKIMYMIEGMTVWQRKNRTIRQRQFASGFHSTGGGAAEGSAAPTTTTTTGAPAPRRRGNNAGSAAAQQEHVDEDRIEDALIGLQVEHGAQIHHTAASQETAAWVSVLTQHLSTVPYRRARDDAADGAGFCMESGQVRPGDGPRDSYVRMLCEINRVTQPIAYGVVARFPTPAQLVRGLRELGPLALENCRKGEDRDGALADRVIGPSVSKRLYKIFTSTDASSTEI